MTPSGCQQLMLLLITDKQAFQFSINLLKLSGQMWHRTPSRQEFNYHQPPGAPQVMSMTKGKRWPTTAQIHISSAEHNPYYKKKKIKGLGIGVLSSFSSFMMGFIYSLLGSTA